MGAVAPVVREAECRDGRRHVLLVEGHDRQQLHVGDAQVPQVGDLLDQPAEGPRLAHAGGRVAGEAAHVQFVDDRALEPDRCGARRAGWWRNDTPHAERAAGTPRGPLPAGHADRPGEGVEHLQRRPAAVGVPQRHAPVVAGPGRQLLDRHVPEEGVAIHRRGQRDLLERRLIHVAPVEQQRHPRGLAAVDGEVGARRRVVRAGRGGRAGRDGVLTPHRRSATSRSAC